MILYHGTDKTYLKNILKKGLLPRKETGKQTYHGTEASNENFVYLSRVHPVSHAYTIDNLPVIIRVDVDPKDFYPDEDYIERKTFFETGEKIPMCDIDVANYKELWEESLKYFGCVAIRSVPKKNIVNFICLDPTDFQYHCGLGAQGNSNIRDLTEFRIDTKSGKYQERLELLFAKGWRAVKKEIIKEKPSSILDLSPPMSSVGYNGKLFGVLHTYRNVHVCDEWIDNVPDRPFVPITNPFLQALADEHSKLLLIPSGGSRYE